MFKFFIVILALTAEVFTQGPDPGKSIDLMGTVIDKTANRPICVKLVFRDGSGKEYTAESNPQTGWYQLLIPPSDDYTVTISSPETIQVVERINLKSMKLSDRQAIDFFVKSIIPGMVVDSLNVFEDKKHVFGKNGEFFLDAFIENLKANPGIKYTFTCIPGDSAFAPELLAGRVATLKNYMEKWKNENFYKNVFIEESSGQMPAGTNSKHKKYNLVITVKEIIQTEK